MQPRTHTIIEAHPDVYKYACSQGWDRKPGVRLVRGRWQDVIDQASGSGKRLACTAWWTCSTLKREVRLQLAGLVRPAPEHFGRAFVIRLASH